MTRDAKIKSVENPTQTLATREAYLELQQNFASNWVHLWTTPNPLIAPLLKALKSTGIGLSNFSFATEAKTLGETSLTISIPSISAAVVIGLDQVIFVAKEPTWQSAPGVIEIFQRVSDCICEIVGSPPSSQSSSLSLHLLNQELDFAATTQTWVNSNSIGKWDFCGLSLHREDASLILDKSLRYRAAAFIKLQRNYGGEVGFADIALRILEDQNFALKLLGISEVS